MRFLILALVILVPAGARAQSCSALKDRVGQLERENRLFRDVNNESAAAVAQMTLDGLRDLETISRLKTANAALAARVQAAEAKVPVVCARPPALSKGPVKVAKARTPRRSKRKPSPKTFEQTMSDLVKNGYMP